MSALLEDLLAMGEPASCRPWPRATLNRRAWAVAIGCLTAGDLSLVDLWGEPGAVHMAVLDEASNAPAVLSFRLRNGGFLSVGAHHAPAIRLERAITDLWGHRAEHANDERPWLDHGRWGFRSRVEAASPYAFLPAEGEALHQIPVGPVHAGIIEPGHFRFTAAGETVVRLEQRLGYVHRGLETLMEGQPIDRAAQLAGRASGDSTVAYALAFARAVEAALVVEPPPRALWLRALMAELERLANHLGDIGAICNDASFSLMHAHCAVLREKVLRAANAGFGHRLMMDRIVPGGVADDPGPAGLGPIAALPFEIEPRFEDLVELYDGTASLQDRTVGTGVVKAELARRFAAGGFVGRASGRAFDARAALAYAPYDALAFEAPQRQEGDVDARVWIRIEEVRQSLGLIGQILAGLPGGPIHVELPAAGGEGLAMVEGFRGDVFAWVRLDGEGRVERARLRDPSWFQWPLLEACIEGNIVADFPLCNKSFNCSYAGVDL
jgi:Ni,Fe-hydrogenase III large subunit